MIVNEHIRQRAKAALSSKGWSQEKLAKRAGVKQATVSRVLAGERIGEAATWHRILDALELELTVVPKEEG